MKNNNDLPCGSDEKMDAFDLIGSIFALIDTSKEIETNNSKKGLMQCVDNEAACTGCPYEEVDSCHNVLMEDALRLIGALEIQNVLISSVIPKNEQTKTEGSSDENA